MSVFGGQVELEMVGACLVLQSILDRSTTWCAHLKRQLLWGSNSFSLDYSSAVVFLRWGISGGWLKTECSLGLVLLGVIFRLDLPAELQSWNLWLLWLMQYLVVLWDLELSHLWKCYLCLACVSSRLEISWDLTKWSSLFNWLRDRNSWNVHERLVAGLTALSCLRSCRLAVNAKWRLQLSVRRLFWLLCLQSLRRFLLFLWTLLFRFTIRSIDTFLNFGENF